MSLEPSTPLTRRRLLGTSSAGLGAVLGLSACRTETPVRPVSTGGPTVGGVSRLPTFQPFSDVEPDLPGTADGVSPAFFNYPTPPIERDGFPLSLTTFSALLQGSPPEPTISRNENYQALFDAVGTDFSINFAGFGSDHRSKLQVVLAGGDLPDLVQLVTVPQMPRMLESQFADLTDHLAGDEITKYPALANIPTPTWQLTSLNGKIWGIAQPRPPAGYVVTARGDILAERGIDDPNVSIRDGADFVDLLKQLTNRDKNEFAMGAAPTAWLLHIIKTMVGTPNVWREASGTFTHEYQTEEFKEALNEAGKIIQAGYLHPNSFSDPSQSGTWFDAGVTALFVQQFTGWGIHDRANPSWNVGNIEIPTWSGGGMAPIRKTPAGYPAYIGFKKASDERIAELLTFADYIASPFGSQQYLDVTYGKLGYSYDLDNGTPVARTNAPSAPALGYLGGNSASVLFGQGSEETARAQHDYLTRAIPDGVDNAADGLYSETAMTKAATLEGPASDLMRDIMLGSKPISAWEEFATSWTAQVGATMAAEYAAAAAEAQ